MRKRSFETASQSPVVQYPNKHPRQTYPQTYQSYPAQPPPLPPQVQQWPGIPPSRVAPWPGQGPPPPGWNSAPVPVSVPAPVTRQPQWSTPPPLPPLPSRPKISRIKGTCYDYLEKGICLRGATVLLTIGRVANLVSV